MKIDDGVSVGNPDSKNEVKSFDELKNIIENATDNSIINLENDYEYNGTTDFNGIQINKKNITINGNNHKIDGKSTNNVRIFQITGSNITLKNIIFTNTKTPTLDGGAIYNKGHNIKVINSTFNNNHGGGAICNVGGGFFCCKF